MYTANPGGIMRDQDPKWLVRRIIITGVDTRSCARVYAIVACVTTAAACGSGRGSVDPAAVDVAAATRETEGWRAMHEQSYRNNWATIAGLHFLEPGSHAAGTAKTNDIVLPPTAASPRVGRFLLDGDVVRFEPEPGVRVLISGQQLTKTVVLADDTAETPDTLEVGSIRMMVHQSGKRK